MERTFLSPEDVTRICVHLLRCKSFWTVENLEEELARIGWTVRERDVDLNVFWVSPDILGSALGRIEADDQGNIFEMILGVTVHMDEMDGGSQALLDRVSEEFFVSLPSLIGPTDICHGLNQKWFGCVYDVEISRDASQMSLIIDNSDKRSITSGSGTPHLLPGQIENWGAFALGVARLAGGMSDGDSVFLMLNDSVVIDISRETENLWLLAAARTAEDSNLLTGSEQNCLGRLGFHPPSRRYPEGDRRRLVWWCCLPFPTRVLDREFVGRVVADALNGVYGIPNPEYLAWSGASLSSEARWAVESLSRRWVQS